MDGRAADNSNFNLQYFMKTLLIGFILVLFTIQVFSQVTFHKLYGDTNIDVRAYAAAQTFDGGYIAAGPSYIIKTDSQGVLSLSLIHIYISKDNS